MGYYEALARRGQKIESEELSEKGTKKSLWGGIGRTVGTLGVMALTGGAVNPLTLGLLTGGASFLGGAIGAKAAGGRLDKDSVWFKKEAQAAQKELGAFGSENITASLKSGLQAGIGQKLKLMKDARAAKLVDPSMSDEAVATISRGKGMDFEGSFVGRHGGTDVLHKFKQGKADLLYGGDRTAASKEIAEGLKSYEFGPEIKTPLTTKEPPWQESVFGGVDPDPSGRNVGQWTRDLFRQYLTPGRGQAVNEAGELITDAQRWPGGYKPAIGGK